MLDTELITYLAKLSKIEIDEADKSKLVFDMSAIVELMDTMNEVTMNDEENLNGESVNLENLREDTVVASYEEEILLKNAAHTKDGFFVVPKIME